MNSYNRVHPDCVNASNPYHECGAACLEKISGGQGRKEKKKSDFANGFNGDPRKIADGERKGNSKCPNASNPYHECNKFCRNRFVRANAEEMEKESGSWKKKTGSGSPGMISNGKFAKPNHNSESPSPRSPFSGKKVIDAYTSHSSSSSYLPIPETQSASEIISQDSLFGKLARIKQNGKAESKNDKNSFNFSLSGISHTTENSEEEDSISVVSDSYVSVGKYNVRPYLASTLQSILEKHGDIGADCRLESASLRSYHLECVSSVVQELESTPVNQLTKSKLKELLAVLKDVEAAQIDVSWLRVVLEEHKEVVELSTDYQSAEGEKVELDRAVESVKKEVRSLEEELIRREESVAATKSKLEETINRLRKLELESSELNIILSAAKAKLEKLHGKPLAERIF